MCRCGREGPRSKAPRDSDVAESAGRDAAFTFFYGGRLTRASMLLAPPEREAADAFFKTVLYLAPNFLSAGVQTAGARRWGLSQCRA